MALPLHLAERARVQLRVFDVGGRLVARLMDRDLAPGVHDVSWEAGGVAPVRPGAYILRLDAGAEHQSRKIVIAP